ncbi:MAG TPA: HlyD family secretion protein [Acetobacteraceae bacterium]|nr:HlyD family secretion protein [Acetobacteraceae bacterium]
MLQAEDCLATKSVALHDGPEQDTDSGVERPEAVVSRPLSREISRETHEPLTPSEREGHAAAPATDTLRKRSPRRMLSLSLGAVLLASVAGGGYLYWDYASHFETTDDAFIAARQFAIAPKVSGYLTVVPVTDNQHVRAGQVIARIDERDYRTALAQAEAQVAAAQASIANIGAQIAVQQAQVAQNESQVQQQQASLTFAQQQESRYTRLAKDGWGTVQDAQQYTSQQREAVAGVKSAQDALVAAARQLAVLKAQLSGAEANLAQAIAQRDQAKLNLSYTIITAAQPGRVVQLSGAVGQYVQPGTAIAMFVPDDIWVTANFKETQLDHMRPGDTATVHIDAYPDHTFKGHLESVQPGSGTAFSLLPAENATGNYVKIVQRVPVKIVLDNPPADVALGPGMSVEPTVTVDPRPSLAQRLWSVL